MRIRDRSTLEAFRQGWRWHNSLELQQLPFTKRQATVKSVTFYQGGGELYELEGIPGIWHEQCLERA